MPDLILIFCIAFIAATISGAAGFGGALILFPVLTAVVGIKAAVPILTIAQIFSNASRVGFGRTGLKWKPVFWFLLAAIPQSIAGSYFFTIIDSSKIKSGISVFLIIIVIYRRLQKKQILLGNCGKRVAAYVMYLFISALIQPLKSRCSHLKSVFSV